MKSPSLFEAQMELKRVEVTWEDAWHEVSELAQKDIEGLSPMSRKTVGYLRKMTKGEVVVASGLIEKVPNGEDSFCDIAIIPRGIVKGILTLNNDD